MMESLLLVSTIPGHAAHSGYQQLAVHLPEAHFVRRIREEPTSAVPGLGFRVVRRGFRVVQRFSFSRWYLSSCVALEAQAWRELRRGFSGIVHSLWADHDLGFLDLLLDRRRHRLVGSFHCCDDTFETGVIRFPRRLRGFDAIILMSRTQESFFLNAGVDPARIHVVPHGVDTEYFRPGTPARKPFVVLGAGWYRRNFPLLREVCLRLKNEADLRFEIVAPEGWRWLFADLPNVRFRSWLNDAEFLDAYQTCSCLLQTVENATANNVILEAMACGQPVVAETIGGIPEYIDPTCAILTAPGQADALAAALLELKASPPRRDALAAGARKRAEMLDWKNIARRMREIYERLAGEL